MVARSVSMPSNRDQIRELADNTTLSKHLSDREPGPWLSTFAQLAVNEADHFQISIDGLSQHDGFGFDHNTPPMTPIR